MSAALARAVAVPAYLAAAHDPLGWQARAAHAAEPEAASSFEGWFASSRDLLNGLRVQLLRIDPHDPLWGELFSPA